MKSVWSVSRQFQQMNETMCTVKRTCDGNWGNICVLAVGDLYQLPPIGQYPVYMAPANSYYLKWYGPQWMWRYAVTWVNNESTQIMRQRDMMFAEFLNNIHNVVLEEGSAEDILLKNCEL